MSEKLKTEISRLQAIGTCVHIGDGAPDDADGDSLASMLGNAWVHSNLFDANLLPSWIHISPARPMPIDESLTLESVMQELG